MKTRYYFDRDDIYRRYIRPWAIGIIAASLIGLGIWWLIDLNIKNSAEYKRQTEISESLSKAPEEGDNRENIPDEEIGNYHYNGEEIIDYPGEIYLVKKVINGNTIVVGFQGQDVTVKLLGVKIPSCYAATAKKETEDVLLGRRIKIDYDEKNKVDENGMTLVYVTIDTFNYNLTMIGNGYAKVDESISYSQKDAYLMDQVYAKTIGIGLWGSCKDDKTSNKV